MIPLHCEGTFFKQQQNRCSSFKTENIGLDRTYIIYIIHIPQIPTLLRLGPQ